MKKELNHICTDLLDIFYEESGDPAGVPVILLHGFPMTSMLLTKWSSSF